LWTRVLQSANILAQIKITLRRNLNKALIPATQRQLKWAGNEHIRYTQSFCIFSFSIEEVFVALYSSLYKKTKATEATDTDSTSDEAPVLGEFMVKFPYLSVVVLHSASNLLSGINYAIPINNPLMIYSNFCKFYFPSILHQIHRMNIEFEKISSHTTPETPLPSCWHSSV
jgi:hypothetical protein